MADTSQGLSVDKSPEEYFPSFEVDKAWSQVQELNVGGYVKSTLQRREHEIDGKMKKCASMCLEVREIEIDAGTTDLLHQFGE